MVKLRKRQGQQSLLGRLRNQETVDGYWTVHGLARELGVDRNWIYVRIQNGSLPALRYRQSGYYVFAKDPELLTALRAQLPAKCSS